MADLVVVISMKVIEGFGVAKVVDSTNPNFCVGDYITGLTGWEEYSTIVRTEQVRKIEVFDVPLSYHVGLLGMYLFLHAISGSN